jgi:hypothetical protein
MEQDRSGEFWTTVGNIALALGVAVWVVYAVMRYGLGMEVSAMSFLPFHLTGVILGMVLHRRRNLMRLLDRARTRLKRTRPPAGSRR